MVRNGNHLILEYLIGEGGFGSIFLGWYVGANGFRKRVVVKTLKAGATELRGRGRVDERALASELASRLRDEARLLGLIGHRAIVRVDDLVLIDGRPAIVMEAIRGADLSHLCRAGPIPVSVVLEIATEVFSALNAAVTTNGANGRPLRLQHRDIKPANIMLTCQGEVKLLDFGIAMADFDDREARTRLLAFGTADYMAPERSIRLYDDEIMEPGPSADVFSLGLVMLELLIGDQMAKIPLEKVKYDEALRERLAKAKSVGVPVPVLDLIQSSMQFEPDLRPDAGNLARKCRALARSIGDGPALQDWAEEYVKEQPLPPPLTPPQVVSLASSQIPIIDVPSDTLWVRLARLTAKVNPAVVGVLVVMVSAVVWGLLPRLDAANGERGAADADALDSRSSSTTTPSEAVEPQSDQPTPSNSTSGQQQETAVKSDQGETHGSASQSSTSAGPSGSTPSVGTARAGDLQKRTQRDLSSGAAPRPAQESAGAEASDAQGGQSSSSGTMVSPAPAGENPPAVATTADQPRSDVEVMELKVHAVAKPEAASEDWERLWLSCGSGEHQISRNAYAADAVVKVNPGESCQIVVQYRNLSPTASNPIGLPVSGTGDPPKLSISCNKGRALCTATSVKGVP